MSHARSVCREYREIKIADLPKVTNSDGSKRDATRQELRDLNIHLITDDDGNTTRKGDRVWALVLGYEGDVLPGDHIAGRTGMYGERRLEKLLELLDFEPEEKAKLTKPLEIESMTIDRAIGEEEDIVITPPILSTIERLKHRIPKVMGDF